MEMGLLCISRGERERGELSLGCWLWVQPVALLGFK